MQRCVLAGGQRKKKMKRGKDWRTEIKVPKRMGDQKGWGNLFPPLSHTGHL